MTKEASFSFTEIQDSERINLANPSLITSSDGIKLAYYAMKVKDPIAGLLFIHGAGAFSGAGYQYLAKGLSEKYKISVYLLDIRGHGNSEGPRGDSPSPGHVFQDLSLMIDFIKMENPKLPLYLGGHSSGGGIVLNFLKWNQNPSINGYIFISPQFGYKSMTARQDLKHPFAQVKIPLFVVNQISQGKIFGNTPAVFFNYPENILKQQPLLIKSITCNMAIAQTPSNPQEQFANIEKPFGLFIGENDELFDPEKVIKYAELPKNEIKIQSIKQIVKNENHLSILKVSDNLIGNTILKINND
jgi:alpha-beta hydrolase superfamily lysophospholipase